MVTATKHPKQLSEKIQSYSRYGNGSKKQHETKDGVKGKDSWKTEKGVSTLHKPQKPLMAKGQVSREGWSSSLFFSEVMDGAGGMDGAGDGRGWGHGRGWGGTVT